MQNKTNKKVTQQKNNPTLFLFFSWFNFFLYLVCLFVLFCFVLFWFF